MYAIRSYYVPYKNLLTSMWGLIKREPVLRESMINGALMFGAFSAFWTCLVFFLETPVYNWGAKEAGMFGLAGVAGALAAPIVGRLADKKNPRFTVGVITSYSIHYTKLYDFLLLIIAAIFIQSTLFFLVSAFAVLSWIRSGICFRKKPFVKRLGAA